MMALDAAPREARAARRAACAPRRVALLGGMTFEDAAAGLARSDRSLERDWRRAKAFLYRELAAQGVTP